MDGKSKQCKYCSGRAFNGRDVCSSCSEKLRLVRKLKEVGEELKKRLEEADDERQDNTGGKSL